MDIVVIRGEGTSPGDDIVDILLSDVTAALSRGRAELDDGALAEEQSLEIALQDLRIGQTIRVEDSALGVWQGKATSISHRVEMSDDGNLSYSTTAVLRKPR